MDNLLALASDPSSLAASRARHVVRAKLASLPEISVEPTVLPTEPTR